jgi:hypothetical protein
MGISLIIIVAAFLALACAIAWAVLRSRTARTRREFQTPPEKATSPFPPQPKPRYPLDRPESSAVSSARPELALGTSSSLQTPADRQDRTTAEPAATAGAPALTASEPQPLNSLTEPTILQGPDPSAHGPTKPSVKPEPESAWPAAAVPIALAPNARLREIPQESPGKNQPATRNGPAPVTFPTSGTPPPAAETVIEETAFALVESRTTKQCEERPRTPEAPPASDPSEADHAHATELANTPETPVLPATSSTAVWPSHGPKPIRPPPPPDRNPKESAVNTESSPAPLETAYADHSAECPSPAEHEAEDELLETEDHEIVPEIPTTPGRYRPPISVTPQTSREGEKKPKKVTEPKTTGNQHLLEVGLQALFDHSGFCTLRLLAARPQSLGSELTVDCSGAAMELIESTDEWYEIAEPPQLGHPLADGILMVTQGNAASKTIWELKGRPIYILAAQHGLAGFVSTTRLSVGRVHVVLCKEEIAVQVQAVLGTSGCTGSTRHGQDLGAPEGWVFFKPVKPAKSVQHVAGEAMHNLLRPLPDIELVLQGGLWLENSTWIAGFPPQLFVSGDLPVHAVVQIDGHPSEKQSDGSHRTPAYDAPGRHSVFCEGKTCSYTIVEPSVGWETWEPLSFGSAAICGAELKSKVPDGWYYAMVPTTHPILIGANPGEIFRCEPRPSGAWSGYVPFKAVWAIPEDALHCKRDTCRILLIAPEPPRTNSSRQVARTHHEPYRRWCRAIIDCRHKKFATEPANQETVQLWALYTAQARNLARKLKHNERQ